MRRVAFYLAMLTSCVLTAVLDAAITKTTGFDPFTFSYFLVLPAGALLVKLVACGGSIGAAYMLHVRPTKVDAAAMAVAGLACMALILFLSYWTYVLPDGRPAHDVVDFWWFTDVSIQSAHYRIGRALENDTGAIGSFGYVVLGLELIGFLLGGVAAYGLVAQLPACEACPSYLRKVRQTSNRELSVEQAEYLLKLMTGGLQDVETSSHGNLPRLSRKMTKRRC